MLTEAQLAAYAEAMQRTQDVQQDPKQCERLRRRPAPGSRERRPRRAEIRRAYEEATGTRIDCD